ncbi:MAG: biopolymer transporter ExbD [Candidatus Omnitrophica bacterium]|nr:biopolymer transporter ExbD [Candidatus Omnitrophota bacterium]
MGSFELERRKKSDTTLNIAPLIDIVFLLLIFFVLSSHFVSNKGFKVKLPKAVSAQTQKNEQVMVSINKEGDIFMNEAEVDLDKLKGLLMSELNKADSKTVVIKADEDVLLGLAVKVMDIAKEANADGLVISTKTANDEKNK